MDRDKAVTFLKKKEIKMQVYAVEKLDEVGARLSHSARKCI
jgi:hypothetical protein